MPGQYAAQVLADDLHEFRNLLTDVRTYAIAIKGLMETGAVVRVQNFPGVLPVNGTVNIGNFPAPAYPAVAVQRSFVSLGGSGVVVAAQPGQAIRLLAACFTATVTLNVELRSGALTPITGGLGVPTANTLVLPFNPHGWCETARDAALRLAYTGTTTVACTALWVTV